MTKRKPRRRPAPKKARRSGASLWWIAGFAVLGWIAFDARQTGIADWGQDLAALMPSQSEPAVPAVRPAAALPAASGRPAERVAAALPAASGRPAERVAAAPDASPARAVAPTRRPGAARQTAETFTGRPTPLRRAPSAEAPVWLTLEAGRPLRITGRQGPWREVETGIFTGWIDAAFVESRPSAAPRFAATRSGDRRRPTPPGSVPAPER